MGYPRKFRKLSEPFCTLFKTDWNTQRLKGFAQINRSEQVGVQDNSSFIADIHPTYISLSLAHNFITELSTEDCQECQECQKYAQLRSRCHQVSWLEKMIVLTFLSLAHNVPLFRSREGRKLLRTVRAWNSSLQEQRTQPPRFVAFLLILSWFVERRCPRSNYRKNLGMRLFENAIIG